MSRILIALALVSATCLNAAAQTVTAVDVSGRPDGKYVLEVKSGVATVTPLNLITPTGPAPGPIPIPVPDPTPTLNERAKKFRDAAAVVSGDPIRTDTAQDLSLAYFELAKMIRAKTIVGQAQIDFFVTKVHEQLLTPSNSKAWDGVRKVLQDERIKSLEEGKGDAGQAEVLEDASAGLLASAPLKGAAAEDEIKAINIEKILRIFQLIMALWEQLKKNESGGVSAPERGSLPQ